MSDNYLVVNEDYELKCCDLLTNEATLIINNPLSITVTKSNTNKINGKGVVLKIEIDASLKNGDLFTSFTIDGTKATFVSASGSIEGTSEYYKVDNGQSVCLFDDAITPLTILTYLGKGSIGELNVVGTNTSSGATIEEKCKIYFGKSGQEFVKAL